MLPEGGGKQARLHAPIKTDARAFMQQQLYGSRQQRVPTATLDSLKASCRGGRWTLSLRSDLRRTVYAVWRLSWDSDLN